MRRLIALAVGLALLAPLPAFAGSPAMPGVGTPVYPASFHLSGQYTASKAGIIQFRMPYTARVLYVSAITQAKGGTQGTSTLTCKNGATNAFTDAMDLSGTAGTVIEAVLVSAYQSIAKDTVVICDLVITGGSNPTLDNISVVIWYQRRN